MKILVTGCAGFIGAHVTKRLIADGHTVIGVDNINDYYDVSLKKARLQWIASRNFTFYEEDICHEAAIQRIFETHQFERVIHLAAQAGVRYSIEYPHSYIQSNIIGFYTILECCKAHQVAHLLYASSSSVYGSNQQAPFDEQHRVDQPMSLYAATKKSNELFAHAYSEIHQLPTTGLRFFTVYGPWGRPDMALFKFTDKILNDEPIDVYNYGEMMRDFTYIDDIVEGIVRLMNCIPLQHTHQPPYDVVNIGRSAPIKLLEFIEYLENKIGKIAKKNFLPLQQGDVPNTAADVTHLFNKVGFIPETAVETGIENFVQWYKHYYLLEGTHYERS